MKNNEFFRALIVRGKAETWGEWKAYNAWKCGILSGINFPLLMTPIVTGSMFEWDWKADNKEVSDFLGTIEKAGFKKFGFFSEDKQDIRTFAAFVKAGWEVTGTVELYNPREEYFSGLPDYGLVFEKKIQ